MIGSLIKLDLRKVLPVYLVIAVATAYFILITRDVLDSTDVFVGTLALVQGWMLAWLVFRDPHHTQAFIFSRPWSRTRIFWHRWGLGMVLQMLTVAVIYTLLATGARAGLHRHDLPYFPMVQRFEFSILWPLGFVSLITFHLVMFLMLRRMALESQFHWWKQPLIKIVLILILIGIFCSWAIVPGGNPLTVNGLFFNPVVIVYTCILTGLCVAASLNCFKNMEIES